ncbi:MAG: NAD(P)-dependent oxidoreductase [Reyranella sp.]|uniref:NAD-dependent epimerase/dehydratase family protein n=1 Tax=Reyranella sp. TaxID=1929291 RepID=UPI00121A45D6|nr:NAD(P)-dependent oxidoreductase [Reyranella sp.]TAJ87760.1 MAG: NAD(P)-dependent oxidoreductase [Reyranella sp.]TBR27232.1 MAG: NAD(P)-dependent oxidoreductase [Reyranella sp.]
MGRLVAVTGATGFVGPHLVAALARRGWRLRLLVRRWSPLPSLAGVDADLILGDLSSESALRRLVDGADAVIHAAGLIKAKADRDFLPVNRDSAALLSALAPDAHMVLLSSLAAREPQLSAYGASKRAGEAVVAGRSGPWTIVRAPAVYGPGDRETLAYFRAVNSGIAPQPRVPEARLSLIHVADLAEALALTLEHPAANATCEIDDGRTYTYGDMAEAAGEALGRRPWRLSVPRGVMAWIARWNELRQALGAGAQILTRGKVNEIFHPDWSVTDRRLAAAIGFKPRYDLTSGFRDTILWYRAKHWL